MTPLLWEVTPRTLGPDGFYHWKGPLNLIVYQDKQEVLLVRRDTAPAIMRHTLDCLQIGEDVEIRDGRRFLCTIPNERAGCFLVDLARVVEGQNRD